jgi:hypothetical protein
MLAPTLTEFPTTVQSPVPTSRAPVTSTDEVSIVDRLGTGMAVASSSSSTRASVSILPEPLQIMCILLDYFSQILTHNITCIMYMTFAKIRDLDEDVASCLQQIIVKIMSVNLY